MVNLSRRESMPMMTISPMERLLERFFTDPFASEPGALAEFAGIPPVDITETDDEIQITASLPGFKQDEITVELEDGVLRISGEHTEEHESHEGRYLRRERRSGSVMRQIPLPANVREDACEAELSDGVLRVHIPKAGEGNARRIEVRAGDQNAPGRESHPGQNISDRGLGRQRGSERGK